MTSYIVATHTSYNLSGDATFGPAHSIVEHIQNQNKKVVFIQHSLHGKVQSTYSKKQKVYAIGIFHNANLLIRSLEHTYLNIKVGFLFSNRNSNTLYIGADPINALSGVVLKKLGIVKKTIYFSVDYADDRYNNILLNNVYHFIDKFVAKKSDEVWCVSSRIIHKRKIQGIKESKLKLVPNSPSFKDIPRKQYDGNHVLIIVSHLSKSLPIQEILEIVKEVKKKINDIQLVIVGSGPEEARIKDFIKHMHLEKVVTLVGQKNHTEALGYISKSFLGFALYSNDNPWNRYGDSMKAREYLASGIPVIINKIPSTSDDIKDYNAGFVVNNFNKKKIVDFIVKCFRDNSFYLDLKKNSLSLAKHYDKENIVNDILEND